MLSEELTKLRKLIRSAERGEGTFEAVYKKLDRVEHILQEDSDEEEEQFTPTHYIKPIQGLLDTYQKSLEKLRQQNRKLMAEQGLRENDPNAEEQQTTHQPASRKPALTTFAPKSSTKSGNGQRSSSSTQAKTVKELDE